MEKGIIIIVAIALFAGSCNRATKQQAEKPSETEQQSSSETSEQGSKGKLAGEWRFYWGEGDSRSNEGNYRFSNDGVYTISGGVGTENDEVWKSGKWHISDNSILFLDNSEFGKLEWLSQDEIKIIKKGYENEKIRFYKNLQAEKKLKHYFHYNYIGVSYFDDGTAIETADPKKEYKYKETLTGLSIDGSGYTMEGDEERFYDDFGYINGVELTPYFEIINYYRIYSRMQITTFESATDKIPAKDIQQITKTCLIFIAPKGVDLNDMVFPHEDADWEWYMENRKTEFAQKGISSVYAKKRYLSFILFDSDKIIIDTKGIMPSSVLLYRKGYIPIIMSIYRESEGEELKQVEHYLNGTPTFKRWSTLNEK